MVSTASLDTVSSLPQTLRGLGINRELGELWCQLLNLG
jgi:hypothetical protein